MLISFSQKNIGLIKFFFPSLRPRITPQSPRSFFPGLSTSENRKHIKRFTKKRARDREFPGGQRSPLAASRPRIISRINLTEKVPFAETSGSWNERPPRARPLIFPLRLSSSRSSFFLLPRLFFSADSII